MGHSEEIGTNEAVIACFHLARIGEMNEVKAKKKRGFASMSPEKLREISRKGGKSVAPEKLRFARDPEFAAECGKRGGKKVDPTKRTFALNPDLASKAGASMNPEKRREVSRMGALALHKKRKELRSSNIGTESSIADNCNDKRDP
jgi:general stress protein YciG